MLSFEFCPTVGDFLQLKKCNTWNHALLFMETPLHVKHGWDKFQDMVSWLTLLEVRHKIIYTPEGHIQYLLTPRPSTCPCCPHVGHVPMSEELFAMIKWDRNLSRTRQNTLGPLWCFSFCLCTFLSAKRFHWRAGPENSHIHTDWLLSCTSLAPERKMM